MRCQILLICVYESTVTKEAMTCLNEPNIPCHFVQLQLSSAFNVLRKPKRTKKYRFCKLQKSAILQIYMTRIFNWILVYLKRFYIFCLSTILSILVTIPPHSQSRKRWFLKNVPLCSLSVTLDVNLGFWIFNAWKIDS